MSCSGRGGQPGTYTSIGITWFTGISAYLLNTPVEGAHPPLEIAHLRYGICWYKWRNTGAIFFDTRPAMMIRSDCRGEPRNTSAPNRAMSNRDALIDIISIAQHAKPNDMGQIEFLRAQFTALSKVVSTRPSEAAAAALATDSLSRRSNRSIGPLAKGASIPFILFLPGFRWCFSLSPMSGDYPGGR